MSLSNIFWYFVIFLRWYEQRDYMNMSWGCGMFLATVFVLTNLLGQLGGVVMVICRLKVPIACGMLFFIVVLQVDFWHLTFLLQPLTLFFRLLHIQFYGTFNSYFVIWHSLEHSYLSSLNREMKRAHCLRAFQASVTINQNHLCNLLDESCSLSCSSHWFVLNLASYRSYRTLSDRHWWSWWWSVTRQNYQHSFLWHSCQS